MSAENVASQQLNDSKQVTREVSRSGTRLLANIIIEYKKGRNPVEELKRIVGEKGDSLNLKLSDMEQSGLLSNSDVSSIRDMMKPLNSYKDLEDGCYKGAAMDHIKEVLDKFQPGDSKTDLMKTIKDCTLAPDSIRMNTKGTPSFEVLKANIHVKAQANGTLLQKEAKGVAKMMEKQAANAIKAGTRSAVTIAGKGAASAVLGVATGGISAALQIVKELTTAVGRGFVKTIGVREPWDDFSRSR